jgi:lysozyme
MRYFLFILFFLFIESKDTNANKQICNTPSELRELSTIKEIYKGIDISKYQSNIDWDNLDLDFIICKKSEGITLEDLKYDYHIKNIKCYKGIYHFFRPQYSGEEQGKFFLSGIDSGDIDIRPIIDVESSKWWNQSTKKLGVSRLCDMIYYIEKEFNCKPIIYTSPKFWNTFICDEIDIKDYKLWVADWRGDTIPEIPCGFNEWSIWQISNQYKINGVSGYVDYNICKNIRSILIDSSERSLK